MASAFAFAMRASASPKKTNPEFSSASSAPHLPEKRTAEDWDYPLLRRSSRHITARLNAKAHQAWDLLLLSRFRSNCRRGLFIEAARYRACASRTARFSL